MKTHRWYYATAGIAAILFSVASFGPNLVTPANRRGPVTALLAIHGLFCLSWLVLFVTQSTLIATRRVALHRRLGFAASGLAIAIIVTGYQAVIGQVRRGFDFSGDLNRETDPAGIAAFSLGDLLSFGILVAAGIRFRRKPDWHPRFMILAMLGGLMPAAIAHFGGHYFPSSPLVVIMLVQLVLLAPAAYDRVRLGHFHRVTLWGGILLVLWANFRAGFVMPSPGWHRFMSWLVG
jgi:hypothetical protein